MNKGNAVKQVIVIRKDLGMRKGKMIAQGCHASLGSYFETLDAGKDEWIGEWEATGTTKIVVGVNSEDELLNIAYLAAQANLPHYLVRDAGRTEFKEPTYTAVGIGPWREDLVDEITGRLTLL